MDELRQAADLYAEHSLKCKVCSQGGAQVCQEGLKLLRVFMDVISQPEVREMRQ